MRKNFRNKIIPLLQAGFTPKDILLRVDCSSAIITYYVKQLKMQLFKRGRKRGPVNKKLHQQIKNYSEIGMPHTRIAELFGISHQRVDQILNPHKHRARGALNHYVNKGKIIKPKKCSKCCSVSNIHGHHYDYEKPLDVEWLCGKCHGKIHSLNPIA